MLPANFMTVRPDITQITSIYDAAEFEKLALQVFQYQSLNNAVYADFLKFLNVKIDNVNSISQIPFLPIEFFKSHIISCHHQSQLKNFFQSSGTGGDRSKHWFIHLENYKQSFLKTFENFFGSPANYVFAFLLPHYQENPNSSLLFMCNELAKLSGSQNCFHQPENFNLNNLLNQLKAGQKLFILGTPASLLLAKVSENINPDNIILVETGGMKGKQKEIIREELHDLLMKKWRVNNIYGEYGMTELFSQAWSHESGIYRCPPWMKVIIKDIYDPGKYLSIGVTGRICVIDLANIDSLSFIQTSDLGQLHENGFRVMGRIDNADLRGCNLLIS